MLPWLLGVLLVSCEFSGCLSCEEYHRGFGGDGNESVGSSDKPEVLTVSVLPTHEHGSLFSHCVLFLGG